MVIPWNYNLLYDVISLSRHCRGTLANPSLHCCFSSLRFADGHLCTALLKPHQSTSVRLRFGLCLGHNILILFSFGRFVEDLLAWFGGHHLVLTDEFMVLSITRWPSPAAAVPALITNPPPPCLMLGMRCLRRWAVFGFSQCVALY